MNRKYSRDQLNLLFTVCIGIGEEAYYTPAGEAVTYKPNSRIFHWKYTSDGEFRDAIYALQDEGAIKVIREHKVQRRHWDDYGAWEIEVIRDKLQLTQDKIQKLLGIAELTDTSQQGSWPTYKANVLLFRGKEIKIPTGDQDIVCSVLFKNKSSMTKIWSWDEVLEKSGESNTEPEMWRRVYNAGREVNVKVAIETGFKDLLVVKKLTINVNPQYLQ